MAFWFQPIWFAQRANRSNRNTITMSTPVHTVLIDVLTDALEPDDIPVWPDASRTVGDAVVVQNAGGDWAMAATSKQRRTRTLRVIAHSLTSDGAERLIDRVFKIIRGASEVKLVTVGDFAGGYNEEAEFYYRGFEVSMRAQL